MAELTLATKYTDEDYLSKKELRKTLGLSSVDYIWNDIVAYRNGFSVGFAPFRTIAGHPFHLTLTDAISAKIGDAEKLLGKIASLFDDTPENVSRLRRVVAYESLSGIRGYEKATLSDNALKAMLSGRYEEGNVSGKTLLSFLRASDAYFALGYGEKGEGFLANALERLSGTSELTSFYRESDPFRQNNLGGLDQVYDYAPHSSIEGLMEAFYEGMENSGASFLVKAVASAYFVDSVMPFERYSGEIGVLLGLRELLPLGRGAYYLPLSHLLMPRPGYKAASDETQKTGDLTYVVLYACKVLGQVAKDVLEKIKEEDSPREAYVPPKAILPEFLKEAESEPEKAEAAKPETEAEKEATPGPEPATREEEPAAKEAPRPRPVEAPKAENSVPVVQELPQYGLSRAPAMSEREEREYARYLLETNPMLSRGQARFYASHCTMGRYYVIQDYKKYCRCAYETARTSMDKLTEQGYYSKLQVKNKFVYTPVKRGE